MGDPYFPSAPCFPDRFKAALCDDFNTADALAVLFELTRDLNRGQG